MHGTGSGMSSRRVKAAGLTYDVLTGGRARGRPVLLLHGWPENARLWDEVTRALHRAGLRTFAPDQRGYSPDARPDQVDAYRQSELVADVLALMDALRLRKVDLVGHDFGAVVAWQVAHYYPERVRTLTAISVPHPAAYYWAYVNDPEQQEKSAYIALVQQPAPVPEDFLLADVASELKAVYAPLPVESVEKFVRPLQEPGAMTAVLNWYRALDLAETGQLGPVTVPTTYLWPTEDAAISRAAAERCAQWVSGPYRYVELDGISHWVPQQVPGTVANEILLRVGREVRS